MNKGDPGYTSFDGCPYCKNPDLKPEQMPTHIPKCDAVPTTDEVVAALKERGIMP